MDEASWDERYGQSESIWSGNPNVQLVREVSDLPAGTALDVGCGEGGDAIWLAEHGWRVTGVDISRVALGRAAHHAEAAGVADRITFLHTDLTDGRSPGTGFDLVTAHYAHLPTDQRVPLYRRLASAVAPGGSLLVVGHVHADIVAAGGPDVPDMFFTAAGTAAELEAGEWSVVVAEEREHGRVEVDGQSLVVHDTVLRAVRR